MSKNYLKLFKDEINSLKGRRPSLLLHVCCGPCSVYPLRLLDEYFDITILYTNSNIYPKSEYDKRLKELIKYLNILNKDIKLVIPKYDENYQKDLSSFGPMKEGGKRCVYCYSRRMYDAFKYASDNNFEYCTTIMSISSHKNAFFINRIGEDLHKAFPNVKYLYNDFKKEGGSNKNEELNKEIGLYRQDYCGCIYTYKVHQSKEKEKNTNI